MDPGPCIPFLRKGILRVLTLHVSIMTMMAISMMAAWFCSVFKTACETGHFSNCHASLWRCCTWICVLHHSIRSVLRCVTFPPPPCPPPPGGGEPSPAGSKKKNRNSVILHRIA